MTMMTTPVPTAILIDSNKLLREGLGRLLMDMPITIVAEAGSIAELLETPSACDRADLLLVDPAGEVDGLSHDGLRDLRDHFPDGRIVVLTGGLCVRRLTEALHAGVDGYLMKDLSADALAQSLRLVMMGEKVFPTYLAELLVARPPSPDMAVTPGGQRKGLSPREAQILGCLVEGDSNKMIANRLGITEATVKVHLKGLLRKVNAANRTQAAIWAMNHGLGGRTHPVATNSGRSNAVAHAAG